MYDFFSGIVNYCQKLVSKNPFFCVFYECCFYYKCCVVIVSIFRLIFVYFIISDHTIIENRNKYGIDFNILSLCYVLLQATILNKIIISNDGN